VASDEFFVVFDFFFTHALPRVILPDDFERRRYRDFFLAYPTVHCLADLLHFFPPGPSLSWGSFSPRLVGENE
jgi:hypothetical protein